MSLIQHTVVLVNEIDQVIGQMEKLNAHQQGLLHRALSVFVFNDENQLLLQQRAFDKYHSRGLWSNTCCSHPFPGEDVIDAGERRLMEEMGMHCSLEPAFHFTYKAELEDGLVENEFDHVLVGRSNSEPVINQEEVFAFKWISMEELIFDIQQHPDQYTYWFKYIIAHYVENLTNCLNHESLQKGNI